MAYNDRNFYQDRNGNPIEPNTRFTDAQGNQYAANALDKLTEYQRLKAGIVHVPPHRQEFDRRFRFTPGEFKPLALVISGFLNRTTVERDELLALTQPHLEALAASGVALPAGISDHRAAVELAHDIRMAQLSGVTTTQQLEQLVASGLHQFPTTGGYED